MTHFFRRRDAGFTLTEMAIVLSVVGVLVAGLWNIISGANQRSRDSASATQQSQLITAVKTFLGSADGQQYMINNGFCPGNCAGGAKFTLPLPGAGASQTAACWGDGGLTNMSVLSQRQSWCASLPPGFSSGTVNSYGQKFSIKVLRDNTGLGFAPNSYSFMVLASGAVIPDSSGGRIASMIGGDGGFIFTAGICSTAGNAFKTACGSYGSWSLDVQSTYGFPASASGSIASRSYASPQENVLNDWLARVPMPGDLTAYTLNTMTTPEYLGSNALVMGGFTPGATPDNTSKSIYMGDYNTPPAIPTAGGGSINMQGGNINFVTPTAAAGGGFMHMQGGTLDFGGGVLFGAAKMDVAGVTITVPPGVLTSGMTMSGGMTYPAGGTSPNPILNIVGGCTSVASGPGTNNPFNIPPGVTPPNACQTAFQVTGDANVFGLLQAYNLYATTFIYQTSDIRLKTNIHPITGALEDIMKLKPVSFTLKADGQDGLGVIAQDLEKIYPQLVVTNKGTKFVNYTGLIAPLIEAVQQLKHDNDELRDELRAQARRQDELMRAISERKSVAP